MKYAWIEAQAGWQPIARLCKVLGVSRSGFLQWRQREPSNRERANRSLDAQVAVIHAEGKQGYGRIRVTRRLRQSGMRIGAERVRKSLLRQNLRTVYRRKYRVTTDSGHGKPVAQNLLDRRFDGWSPNQAWTTDITYLLTDEGWLYLAAIVDLGTRRIVGWAMSGRMSAKLVCDALQMAYWRRRPDAGLLMHSDRGSQYASNEYRKLLKQFHMTQSMSRKGNCWDNAPMESFFKTLKVERTNRLQYTSRVCSQIGVPVQYSIAKYDTVWTINQTLLNEFAEVLAVNSPDVESAITPGASHGIGLGPLAMSHIFQVLSFVARCHVAAGAPQMLTR